MGLDYWISCSKVKLSLKVIGIGLSWITDSEVGSRVFYQSIIIRIIRIYFYRYI